MKIFKYLAKQRNVLQQVFIDKLDQCIHSQFEFMGPSSLTSMNKWRSVISLLVAVPPHCVTENKGLCRVVRRDVVEWKEHRFESQEDPISISAPLLIPLVVLDIF